MEGLPICEDIDECSNENMCPSESLCINSDGSYECVCNNGFNKQERYKFYDGYFITTRILPQCIRTIHV